MIDCAYFDTSYLAKLHWNERGSTEVAAISRNFQHLAWENLGKGWSDPWSNKNMGQVLDELRGTEELPADSKA
jgi:hypothetical protein